MTRKKLSQLFLRFQLTKQKYLELIFPLDLLEMRFQLRLSRKASRVDLTSTCSDHREFVKY